MEILKPFKWTQVVWILKLICIILLPSGLWAESGPVKVIQLEFVKTLPHANEEKVFFKMIPHIALDNDGNIFAIQNGYHFVFKMDPKGKFVSRIGRKGQGPGELYRPFRIEIFENKLFVKDRTGISIFQVDGAYQERFRLFSPFIAMAPWQNKIAVAEATPHSLVTEYDYTGKKTNTFGFKYKPNYPSFKAWTPQSLDNSVNNGKLFFYQDQIYFVSKLFGEVFKYSLDGKLTGRSSILLKSSEETAKKNKGIFFNKDYVTKSNQLEYGHVFLDAELSGESLFLLLPFKERNRGKIIQIDIHTLIPKNEYQIRYTEKNQSHDIWTYNFEIKRTKEQLVFFIPLINKTKEEISIYKFQVPRR